MDRADRFEWGLRDGDVDHRICIVVRASLSKSRALPPAVIQFKER